jgi:pyruvate dehydrogenase E2 component (dihydrolipoamide acetyltransferase)
MPPIEVTMPKLSDTMEEGKILRWLKHEGDRVAIGDVLAEVETDKANMELEAYDEGTLAELKVAEGESAPVGSVIALLAAAGEQKGATATPSVQPAPEKAPDKASEQKQSAPARPVEAEREVKRPTIVRRPEPAEPATRDGEPVRASPLAKKIAREHEVDLHALRGTGPGGRIVEKDVRAALGGAAAEPVRGPAPSESRPAPRGRVELSRIRRTTAKRMGEAKREVPHFYASAEIAMDEAVRLKEGLAAQGGDFAGITFTHLVVKAVALALVRVPELNASYDGDAMVLHDAVNVGMAAAVDDGLVVPVLHHTDRESLAAIVRQAQGLVERARAGRFGGDDLSGGTFTVSNLGMFPVSDFAAVINPPQAAILAVGTIRDAATVREGRVVAGRMMTVTLSCDHRIIDGVLAGRFLRELKALLERPLALLL